MTAPIYLIPEKTGAHRAPLQRLRPKFFSNLLLRTTLIILCFAGVVHASGEYQTFDVASLKIILDTEWASQTAPGYLPVRVDIINEGDERTIEVFGQGNRFRSYVGAVAMDVRQAVHLKRGDRVHLTLPVPVFADNENIQFQIREGGRLLQGMGYTGLMSGRTPDQSPVLFIADPATPFFSTASTNLLRSMKTPAGAFVPGVRYTRGSTPTLDFILSPARVPTNWLGFTSLRAVLADAGQWTQLTEAQRSALLAYVACGGTLMLVDGSVNQVFPGLPAGTSPTRYLLGTIRFPKLDEVMEIGLDEFLTSAASNDSAWSLPANHEPEWGSIAENGFRLPISGVGGIPVRAYLAILVVFSLVIGPANFFFLWRKRQAVLLVLTVPLIALLFIALLGGYVVAGEGFGIHGRAQTFTILDQDAKQAATRASVSLYAAGMTPSGGLRFGRDMAVFPIGTDGRGSEEPESIDLTNLQQFSSGIVRARTPSNFEELGFRAARERLSFSGETDHMAVVNALGVTVQRLLFRENGKIYVLNKPLPAGEKSDLSAGSEHSTQEFLDKVLQSARYRWIREAIDKQTDGSYIAVLDRSPFWDPGVPSIEERESFHLVVGLIGVQP
jgi:hypothetical protein